MERLQGAFRTFNKIPKDSSVRLVFDGDTLEPEMTVEEAEIEDLNMIEVLVK